MADVLSWQSQQHRLILQGELNHETLLPLWQQRVPLLADKTCIDVSQLERVDSTGLALLLNLCAQQSQHGIALKISGIRDQLRTLITLYNLQHIIPVERADLKA